MVHHQHQQQRRNGGGGEGTRRVEVPAQVARKRIGGGRPLMKMDRGYAAFAEELKSKWQKHQPGVDFTYFQLAELCVEEWKLRMTSEQKRIYRILGKAKYTRNGKRIGTRTPVNGQQVSAVPNGIRARDAGFARRRLFVDEPEPPTMEIVQKPKGASNSFVLYAKAERAKLASKNRSIKMRDGGGDGVGSRISNKELGLMWQVADPETKAHYNDLAKDDRERYAREFAVYKQQQEQRRRGLVG